MMREKQIRSLAQIAIVYLGASIILDAVLGGYKILLWPALALVFLLFATMITKVVWEPVLPITSKRISIQATNRDDELTRLEQICKHAIEEGDPLSGQILSQRVSSLALAAVSLQLNEPESSLREIGTRDPDLLHQKITDQGLLTIITSPPIAGKIAVGILGDYLTRIEEWTR